MENLQYQEHRSRKCMGLHLYHTNLVVNGNWIVGIQPVVLDTDFFYSLARNEIFVLNRWTLELEKVLISNAVI